MDNAIFCLVLAVLFLYQSDRAEKLEWEWQALAFVIAHLVAYVAAWSFAWSAWLS